MTQLFNTFEDISIDEKGRLSLPASFRKALAREAEGTFMIIQGTDGCLRAYPRDQWLVYWARLQKLSRNRDNTRLVRRILGNLKETRLDGQGRMTLTLKHKEMLGASPMPQGWRSHLAELTQGVSYDEDLYRAEDEIDRLKDGRE
jgi:division/cell wall cluster transcriptional repressor MraZ